MHVKNTRLPKSTPERIAKALRKPINYYEDIETEDIYIRAFEEAKGFVVAYLGFEQSDEDRFDSPILNYVVGMAHMLEKERVRASIAEQMAGDLVERLGLAPTPASTRVSDEPVAPEPSTTEST